MDHYATLGLDPSGTHNPDDIKNAFRRLTLRYHPDRAKDDPNAAQAFLAVTHAYEILGNPQKKADYDTRRKQATVLTPARKAAKTWRGFGRGPKKGETTRLEVPIRLAEMESGVTRPVKFPRAEPCETCGGSGDHPHTSGPCGKCQGRGLTTVTSSVNLKIRGGVRPGSELLFTDIGSYDEPEGLPGDIAVVIALAAAPGIKLNGDTVEQTLVLSIAQAQNGVELRVHLPDGATRRVRIPPGVLPGMLYRLIGGGLSSGARPKGDYILRIGVWISPLPTDGNDTITPEITLAVSSAMDSLPGDLSPLGLTS